MDDLNMSVQLQHLDCLIFNSPIPRSIKDEPREQGYRWETDYEKTWESVREDETGALTFGDDDFISQKRARRTRQALSQVRLGMMRHLFVVIDQSEAMMDQDMKPNRYIATLRALEFFLDAFFDQNPIGQLGIIATKNKRATRISELGGNPRRHLEELKRLEKSPCEGEPSLQNSLIAALNTLKYMPSHSSREIVFIFGSITTCDPGDVHDTIQELKAAHVRCSFISLGAEVFIFKHLCQATHGFYHVTMDDKSMLQILQEFVKPLAATADMQASLIRMGFPHGSSQTGHSRALVKKCMCHLEDTDPGAGLLEQSSGQWSEAGYQCPQCQSAYCSLPVECRVCGLTLLSAPHLSRSYHHLFPLAPFTEERMPVDESADNHNGLGSSAPNKCCAGCNVCFSPGSLMYRCPKCSLAFCLECDLFLHESVHSCPNCFN